MGDLIVSMLVNIAKGIRRVANVWRKAPDESHTAVEYADALLFSEEHSCIVRLFPSTVDPHRRTHDEPTKS